MDGKDFLAQEEVLRTAKAITSDSNFLKWCIERGIDPENITVNDIECYQAENN